MWLTDSLLTASHVLYLDSNYHWHATVVIHARTVANGCLKAKSLPVPTPIELFFYLRFHAEEKMPE